MTSQDIQCFSDRAQMVLDNVRLLNGGDTIHAVSNLRHSAQMFLEMIKSPNPLLRSQSEIILCSLEKRCVEIFKEKFRSIGNSEISCKVYPKDRLLKQ